MSNETEIKGNEKNGTKRGIGVLVALIFVIVILGVVIVFLLVKKTPVPETDNSSSTETSSREVADTSRVILDQKSADNVMEDMRKEVEEGMFECKMSMTWTFPDGTSESPDAYVANSENNKYPIYFDVTLDDTGEQIYSSPILPVGTEINNLVLTKDLEPGTYDATVMYTLIRDEESQEKISSAGFIITIIVNE